MDNSLSICLHVNLPFESVAFSALFKTLAWFVLSNSWQVYHKPNFIYHHWLLVSVEVKMPALVACGSAVKLFSAVDHHLREQWAAAVQRSGVVG